MAHFAPPRDLRLDEVLADARRRDAREIRAAWMKAPPERAPVVALAPDLARALASLALPSVVDPELVSYTWEIRC